MSRLVEFLLARIAEDEDAARRAGAVIPPGDGWYRVPQLAIADPEFAEWFGRAYLHIAGQNPARVLAECEAKRRIISLHRQYEWPSCDGGDAHGPENCETLRILASVYADHPDFRAEWGTS